MLSSTFELIFMASSNSHIVFCFCNFIIAILLLSGFQSSTNLGHDMSKRKEAQGNSKKARQFHKGMNFDYEVRKMGTCVTLQEMRTFNSVLSDTSIREVLRNVNQDNKSGAYEDAARSQHHEFANFERSHYLDTSFKCENVEGANANDTIDREMDTRVTSIRKVLRDINQDNKNGAYDGAARFQHHESENCKQSHHQDTSFERGNIEGASANYTIDTKMYYEDKFEKSDEKEEDELRKRIEDFIEKINRGWRAEKLGICYQSQLVYEKRNLY
ncbi:hypothetical protein HAX54_031547 [Datura stramonium]|uniref:Uncharacterized protein n=1 Tax=Datura stramonium TaxID=4076 RepID=A0ABS8RKC1_DATST|nr:hypothetical protein [Datura stramonium]